MIEPLRGTNETQDAAPELGRGEARALAGTPEGPDVATVRMRLGLGGPADPVIPADEVDRLLRGALEGFDEVRASARASCEASGKPSDAEQSTEESAAPCGGADAVDRNLELLRDVHLQVRVEFGRGRLSLEEMLRLGRGSEIELERLAGDPLDIRVDDRVVARGEILVLDEHFCIRITEVVDREPLSYAL